ncbi:MAG: hypothetical protein LBF83_04300, partial [Spirochaetaceae bacterium]|nr:hypothetical protein [Spirochaetaceae bacterium]
MKKSIFGKVFTTAVFVAMAALMFSGCEQSTGGSGGTGTVTVSILFDEESGTDEPQNLLGILWTVHPDVSGPAFVRFTATFEATSGGAAHAPVDLSVGEPASVTLTAGTYTVTVTGYTGTEGSYVAAAIGSAEGIVVTGGTNTEASILMAPNAEVAGKGSFSYSITAPAGATGTLTIQQDGQPVGNSVTLTGGNDPVTGTIDLDAGVYLVFVYLTKDGGYTAGLVEALHIYNGMESTLTEEYEGEDFIEPQTVTSHSLTSFFAAPVTDAAPATSFGSASDQYTGTIQWKAGGINFTDTAFAAGTVYTAVVTLQANPNFTLTGVAVNSFIHENATSQTNSANDGVVTLVFPATEGAGTGTQSIVIGFNYGEITVTGAGATIYKT